MKIQDAFFTTSFEGRTVRFKRDYLYTEDPIFLYGKDLRIGYEVPKFWTCEDCIGTVTQKSNPHTRKRDLNLSYVHDSEIYSTHPVGGSYVMTRGLAYQEDCGAIPIPNETPRTYSTEDIDYSQIPIVEVYVEVAHDILESYDSSVEDVFNMISQLFIQSRALYLKEGIEIVIKRVMIRRKPTYDCDDSLECLEQFQQETEWIDADVGILLSTQASGGVAYLNGACANSEYRRGFASLEMNLRDLPLYSWDVMVITHELGHLFGSNHTHACVWNGNNTAIDSCPGWVEGNCQKIGSPKSGGTIMSYCHFTTGISFSKGFGQQPQMAMKGHLLNSECIDVKEEEKTSDSLYVEVQLGTYPHENTLDIYGPDGSRYRGFAFDKLDRGKIIKLTIPDQSYRFVIKDTGKDGMENYCEDDKPRITIYSGTSPLKNVSLLRTFHDEISFRIVRDTRTSGIEVPLNQAIPYKDQDQDFGFHSYVDGTLKLGNNSWKIIKIDPVELDTSSTLSFDFKSTIEGEIHGVAILEYDDPTRWFEKDLLFQTYGVYSKFTPVQDHHNYSGKDWKTYTVNIPRNVTAKYIVLLADDDREFTEVIGNSFFKNITINV